MPNDKSKPTMTPDNIRKLAEAMGRGDIRDAEDAVLTLYFAAREKKTREPAMAGLISALSLPDKYVRRRACDRFNYLAWTGVSHGHSYPSIDISPAVAALSKALSDKEEAVSWDASCALTNHYLNQGNWKAIDQLLNNKRHDVRHFAVSILVNRFKQGADISPVIPALIDECSRILSSPDSTEDAKSAAEHLGLLSSIGIDVSSALPALNSDHFYEPAEQAARKVARQIASDRLQRSREGQKIPSIGAAVLQLKDHLVANLIAQQKGTYTGGKLSQERDLGGGATSLPPGANEACSIDDAGGSVEVIAAGPWTWVKARIYCTGRTLDSNTERITGDALNAQHSADWVGPSSSVPAWLTKEELDEWAWVNRESRCRATRGSKANARVGSYVEVVESDGRVTTVEMGEEESRKVLNISPKDTPGGKRKLNESLIKASGERNLEKVKALLERGADVNARVQSWGDAMVGWDFTTPLMAAVLKEDNIEMVRYLVEKGANPLLAREIQEDEGISDFKWVGMGHYETAIDLAMDPAVKAYLKAIAARRPRRND